MKLDHWNGRNKNRLDLFPVITKTGKVGSLGFVMWCRAVCFEPCKTAYAFIGTGKIV